MSSAIKNIPYSDQTGENHILFSDKNCSKTIPFRATHTYIACLPPPQKKNSKSRSYLYTDAYLIELLPSNTICWFQQITGHLRKIFHIFLGAHVALLSIEVGQCNKYIHGYYQVPSEDFWWPFRIVHNGLGEVHEL